MNGPPSVGPDRDRNSSSLNLEIGVDRRVGGRRIRVGAGLVGVLALALALALVGGLGGRAFADAVGAVVWPARPFVYFFAHFALVLGAWSLWRGRAAADDGADVTVPTPASADDTGERLVGEDIDEAIDALTDPETAGNGWKRVDVQNRVRGLAMDVLRAETGGDAEEVAALLESGEWTDDPRAAAYLGDDVPAPVRVRVADWASGDPFRRRVEATVAELAAVTGVEAAVSGAEAADAEATVDRHDATADAASAAIGSDAGSPASDAGAERRGGAVADDGSAETREATTGAETTASGVENRWAAGVAFALAAVALGVFLSNTGLFLAAIVGLAYAGVASLSRPPSPSLVVERRVDPIDPDPGDRIAVTVAVRNAGDRPLADVRVADDPPSDLDIADGDARGAATLEAGERATVEYELTAVRGRHEFGDVTVVARSASGEAVRRTGFEAAQSLVCHARVDSLPLAAQTGIGAGRVETDSGGEGVEFYATREYAPGDAASRVDWNRYASTGELTTVTYRESKAATVVFVVDGRAVPRAAPGDPDAGDLCGYAAVRLADDLLDGGTQVGASVLSRVNGDWFGADGTLPPATGTEQSLRLRALLRTKLGVAVDDLDVTVGRSFAVATGDAAAADRAGGSLGDSALPGGTRGLGDALPAGAQVVFVSPLLDDDAVRAVERLVAHEHVTTVVSPDLTGRATAGTTVERIERAERIGSLTGTARARLVDWSPAEPLQVAVDRAAARWDR